MSLVSAKCPNCNMNLEVDNTKDAAICPFCGAPYVVEKAINYFITENRNNVETKGNTYESNSADFVIRAGTLERYNGASVEAVVPNTVTIIGESAFENCIGLIKVIISNSVTEIREKAFAGCERLTEISMPNSINKIGNSAFENCIGLIKVVISNSVTEIKEKAFAGCERLTEISMPNSINKIGNSAFENCTKLKKVIIPNSVTEIGFYAFHGCKSLTEIVLSDNISLIEGNLFSDCIKLDNVIIPHGVTEIKWEAFKNCQSLSKITIPDTVELIRSHAFCECKELKTIKISDKTAIEHDTFKRLICGFCHDGPSMGEYVENVIASEEWKKKYCKCLVCLSDYDKPEVQPQPQKSSGCYIATCVYGSYDCPQVWVLRRFRDYTLDESWYGRVFIKCYYAISPILVRWFGTKELFIMFWEKRLDKMVSKLKSEGIADTEYCDKY